MNSTIIFSNSSCTAPVDHVIFEGRVYYVLFPTTDALANERAIRTAGLEGFVTWHARNVVATLQIINRIGLLHFFDEIFDVRSQKFLESLDGKRQFDSLLDDLVTLSRDIRFQYLGTTSAVGTANYQTVNATLLERFSFYKHLMIGLPTHANFDSFIASVIKMPKSQLVDEYIEDYIWAVRRPTRRTIDSALRNSRDLVQLDTFHRLSTVGVPGLTPKDRATPFLPLRASMQRSVSSLDIQENRFIKHILLDIDSVCRDTLLVNNLPERVSLIAQKMLGTVRGLLRGEFFKSIGKLEALPTASPTLAGRRGYRELYKAYLQSRLGTDHIFDMFCRDSLFIDLKDISELYEYWVFYRVALSLLGSAAVLNAKSTIIKDGKIVQAISVSSGNVSVAYNSTFTRTDHASYSVNFRPDIVVTITLSESPMTILLDAKYKSRVKSSPDSEDDDTVVGDKRVVTTADLHKMHSYIDAIDGACCAMAIYPGTEFVFYPRNIYRRVARHVADVIEFEGVGAIPLLPRKGPEFELQPFELVMSRIKALARGE